MRERYSTYTVNLGRYDWDETQDTPVLLHERTIWPASSSFALGRHLMVLIAGVDQEIFFVDEWNYLSRRLFHDVVAALLAGSSFEWKYFDSDNLAGVRFADGWVYFGCDHNPKGVFTEVGIPEELAVTGLIAAGLRLANLMASSEHCYPHRLGSADYGGFLSQVRSRSWSLPEQPPAPVAQPNLPPRWLGVALLDSPKTSDEGRFIRGVLGDLAVHLTVYEDPAYIGVLVGILDLQLSWSGPMPVGVTGGDKLDASRQLWCDHYGAMLLTSSDSGLGLEIARCELYSRCPKDAAEEYARWWGCRIEVAGDRYLLFGPDDVQVALFGPTQEQLGDEWICYIRVAELSVYIERALNLGGTIFHQGEGYVVLGDDETGAWVAIAT